MFQSTKIIVEVGGILGDTDVGVVMNAQGLSKSYPFDLATIYINTKYVQYPELAIKEWNGFKWITKRYEYFKANPGDRVVDKVWQIGKTIYFTCKDLSTGVSETISGNVKYSYGYIGIHQSSAEFLTPSKFDWIRVRKYANLEPTVTIETACPQPIPISEQTLIVLVAIVTVGVVAVVVAMRRKPPKIEIKE